MVIIFGLKHFWLGIKLVDSQMFVVIHFVQQSVKTVKTIAHGDKLKRGFD